VFQEGEQYPEKYWRPTTRGDCVDGPRPCPYVGCKHHLYLDVLKSGNLSYNFPDKEPHELEHSCALDVAEGGKRSTRNVGKILNISHGAVQLISNKIKKDSK
jgi:hypothetical protein